MIAVSPEEAEKYFSDQKPEHFNQQIEALNHLHPDVVTSLLIADTIKNGRIQVSFQYVSQRQQVQFSVAIAWLSAVRYAQAEAENLRAVANKVAEDANREADRKTAGHQIFAGWLSVVFAALLTIASFVQAGSALHATQNAPKSYPPVISPPAVSSPTAATQ